MRKNDSFTSEGFTRLLGWLDRDPEAAGQRYEALRVRLIKVFAGRGCHEAEELADRTFDRVIKKLPEIIDSYVGDPSHYFLSVGRHIHLEWLRGLKQNSDVDVNLLGVAAPVERADPEFDCLDECLKSLPSNQSELLISYYREDKSAKIEFRRTMAEGLGITPTALQIRLHRIRKALRGCVEDCTGGVKG